MKFEDLQNQWQREGSNATLQISYDMLLKEVGRNQRSFERVIFWRDVQEFAASLVGVCIFIFFGIVLDRWFYTAATGMLYLAVFFVVYRRFRPKRSPAGTASLRTCVEESLDEVNCQIHLLSNVFWWYLLVPTIGGIFPFAKISYALNCDGVSTVELLLVVGCILGDVLIIWWICWMNQRCVKKDLMPRKQELEELLHSMGNGSGELPAAVTVNLWKTGVISVLAAILLSTPLLFINKTSWLERMMENLNKSAVIEITPPLTPEEEAGPKELKILLALYGAEDQWIDVTRKVSDAVSRDTLSIHSGNELAGEDPKFGYPKALEIECLWDGQKKTIRVPEGMTLKIPYDANLTFGNAVKRIASEKKMPPLDNPYLNLKELKVLSARYGAREWWVDVTQKVVETAHDNILFIASGNQLTDKEPPDGSLKMLEIKYLLGGQPYEAQVREGTLFTIPVVLLDPNDERRVIETEQELYRLAEACPAELGFYGKSFTTGKELAYRPGQPACLASIVKIFVLLELSKQIENGRIDPQNSVTILYKTKREICSLDKAVDLMIGQSDNDATAALAKLVGYDRVNALAGELSMGGISPTILPEPGKLGEVLDMRVFKQRMIPKDQLPPQHGTAKGVVGYFELLHGKRLINEAISERVLEAMERNPKYFASNATPSGYQSVGKGGSILWVRPPRPHYSMSGWGVYIYNDKEALAFCIWAEWFPEKMDETQRWQWMTGLSNCIVNLLLEPESRTWIPQTSK